MAMLPAEQKLATRLMIAMADWPQESRANMVEWVNDALKEQRVDGIVAGLQMADKFLTVSGNKRDAASMIQAAIAATKSE